MQGMMRATEIISCYMGPRISPEEFIAEHFFLYLAKGRIEGYDGHRKYELKAGEYCLVRRNHLARYNKQKDNGLFEKVVVVFDEGFLKTFRQKHPVSVLQSAPEGAFVKLKRGEAIPAFIASLMPYYKAGQVEEAFADTKREELLLLLLQANPRLADVLFDFAVPEKIDLEAFMRQNYKFNVKLERFAYLTGRSLSAFKRDFKDIFADTPGRWLIRKRLQEAHFLLEKKGGRSADIYLDLGFEDLSHFSYAFKKHFGYAPTRLPE